MRTERNRTPQQLWILGLHQIENDTDVALTRLNMSLISVASGKPRLTTMQRGSTWCVMGGMLPQDIFLHSLFHILETSETLVTKFNIL